MTRAVCYSRVSSATQRERETIASQLRDLPALVQRQGWNLVYPATAFVDDGRSAKSGQLEKRTGLDALMRAAARGEFDVVVVADVDRLTRSEDQRERGAIIGAFAAAGVKIATLSGQIFDGTSSEGDLYLSLQGFFAADWLRKHRARIVAGKLTSISRGYKPSGPTPYGLAFSRVTHTWSIDQAAADVVREIYSRVAARTACQAIADDLHARGLRLPRGGEWTRSRVYQIVNKRTYVGQWLADKRRQLVVAVPPIVTEAQWQAAQDGLKSKGRVRGAARRRHAYLLEGIARCGTCGAPIWIRSACSYVVQGERRPSPAAYQCARRKEYPRGTRPCAEPPVRIRDLDERVWACLQREIGDPDLVGDVARRVAARSAESRDWQADAAGYRKRLSRLERHERDVLARARRSEISSGALDHELAGIRRERTALQHQVTTAERAIAAGGAAAARLDGLAATLAALRERLPEASPEQRRRLLEALVERGSLVVRDGRAWFTIDVTAGAGSAVGGDVSSDRRTSGYSSDTSEEVRLRVVA